MRPARSNVISLIAGLAVLLAGASLARAADEPAAQTGDEQAKPEKPKKVKKHPNKTQLEKAERGNPHSVIYKSRKKSAPNPTDAEIQAGESGDPSSVDQANRKRSEKNPTDAEINAGEKGNPHSTESGR